MLLTTLTSVPHAALAQPIIDFLKDNNIFATVNSDDCGGLDPSLAFSNGIYVMVPQEQLEDARTLYEAYQSAPIIE